jgi:transglutaminase-like putative cysteine protease
MLIRCGYEISLACAQPTPIIILLSTDVDLAPHLTAPESFFTVPEISTSVYLDTFRNQCRRLTIPAGTTTLWGDFTIENDGKIDVANWNAHETPPAELDFDSLVFLLGSRYCETDLLSQIAWDMFGKVEPGWNRVQAICDFVHQHIRFDYMQARSTRTAFEAYTEATGVCRDYAHLALTLCRCLNIPARYVNGYLGDIGVPIVDPMDFSAWIEVLLDGQWYPFDPRNNMPRMGRVVVARGRDAADVPLINSFGPHTLEAFRVWSYEVSEQPAAGAGIAAL